MSFSTFVAALSKGLWFARVDTLDDEHEGFASAPYVKSFSEDALLPVIDTLIRKQNPAFFVNCWHGYEGERDFLWKLYALEGVAVETTYSKLRSSLEQVRGYQEIAIGPIKYYDDAHEEAWSSTDDIACLRKRKAYEPEREFRAIINLRRAWLHTRNSPRVEPQPHEFSTTTEYWFQDNQGRTLTGDEMEDEIRGRRGFYVPVDVKDLIDKIFLPPNLHKVPWIEDAVRFICAKSGIPADKIFYSKLSQPPPVTEI